MSIRERAWSQSCVGCNTLRISKVNQQIIVSRRSHVHLLCGTRKRARAAKTMAAATLRPSTFLVFGGTGGTGKQFISQALDQGHTVRALVRNPAKVLTTHPNLHVHQGRPPSNSRSGSLEGLQTQHSYQRSKGLACSQCLPVSVKMCSHGSSTSFAEVLRRPARVKSSTHDEVLSITSLREIPDTCRTLEIYYQ